MRKADADRRQEQELPVEGVAGSQQSNLPSTPRRASQQLTLCPRLLADHFGTPLFCPASHLEVSHKLLYFNFRFSALMIVDFDTLY